MPVDDEAARLSRELFVRTRLTRLTEPGLGPLAAHLGDEVTFEPGAVLYGEGDPPVDFYAFTRGHIRVTSGDLPPWVLRNQSGIGLLDVLADRPRNATVSAVTRVHAMRIKGHAYLDFLEEHYEFAMESALVASKDVHELSLALAPDGGFPFIDVPSRPSQPPPRPMNLVEKIEVLRRSRLFRMASVQPLVRLAMLGAEVRAGTGDPVFARGEAAGRFFLVAEGIVEAAREAPDLVARWGPGDLVCGYGALGAADNQYAATARVPSVVLAFSEEDFFDVMEEHFDLTRSVLAAIAGDYTRLVLERERRAAGPASRAHRLQG